MDWMDGIGWDISQTTRNTRAPGGAKKIVANFILFWRIFGNIYGHKKAFWG